MSSVISLYTHQGKAITDADFLAALRSLDVAPGDILFVQSDVRSFGRLAVSRAEVLLGALVDIFEKSVGKSGTIIMPTFSFSFGANKDNLFDMEKTRSTAGSLTEYFRQLPGVVRTAQPMMSVAVWGAGTNKIIDIGKDTFGKKSVLDNLLKEKGKIVMLGTDFSVCTFLHYVEQMQTVPYRFMKTFTGTIIDHGRSREESVQYYARPLDAPDEKDFNRVVPHLRKKNLLHEVGIGSGSISVVSAVDLFDVAITLLQNDPYALLKRVPKKNET